jgi:hypothetical protein
MLDMRHVFGEFLTDSERQRLAAIRYVHRHEIAARALGFHLHEYRRLVFWRRLHRDRLFGPPEHWL